MLLRWGTQASNLWYIILVVTLLAPGTNCFFPTDWKEKYFGKNGLSHESQTKRAFETLAAKYFPDIKPLKKTMLKARDAIAKANADVDDDQKTSGKHFDGESFEAGATRLITLKGEVFDNLNAGNGEAARESLGGALHTLQDFYAHTNWVELGNNDINYDLGNSSSLSHATFNDTTCSECGPASRLLSQCHDCSTNTNGFTLLTSGYYFGEDSPPKGIAIPDYKCHHGGVTDNSVGAIWGVAVGDVTPGINKDSNNCFWSPHSDLHPKAADLAVKATIQYIEDIVTQLDEKKRKLLFGVGATMAFAIDTTGSMSDVIASVRQQSISIVSARLGTPDEPSSFVVSPFNDPTTGPDTVTSDFATFQSAISSLTASGGGDCPELAMTGILDAMSLMDGPADLFVMTDAAAKDYDLVSQVIATAVEKNINIHVFKFDSGCDDGLTKRQDSASNEVYGSIALASGGSYHSLPRDEVDSISGLLDTITKSDSTGILKINDTAGSNKTTTYKVPVDSQMIEFSISVRGAGITCSLTKPDGSALDLTLTGVTSTVLTDGQFITVKSPISGTWKITVIGDASFSLDATGVTSLHLSSFNFVAISGRPGHEGYFPITGQPAYDHDVAAVGVLDGTFSSAKFDLRSPQGAVVVDSGMEPGSGEDGEPPSNSFYGEMTLIPGTLYAYCSGVDGAGAPFQRVLASVFTPVLSNVTDTGFNNTDPFAVLNNSTSSNTTATSTSVTSSSALYTNATTTSTIAISSNSSGTYFTSTSRTQSPSPTSSWPSVTTHLSDGYFWTPPPYATSTWRNPHTCKPGIVYTHSAYDWDDSETVTEVTYTKATSVSGTIATLTLTTTSLVPCSNCDTANYPEHTDEDSWGPVGTGHTGSVKPTTTKSHEYPGWSSQTKNPESTSAPAMYANPSSIDSPDPLSWAPWSTAAASAPGRQPTYAPEYSSEAWPTAAASTLGRQPTYTPDHTTIVSGDSRAAASGTTTTPAVAQWTGSAEQVYGIAPAVWVFAVAGGLVMI